MRRRDGTANTGCIKWPHLENSAEGGMFVVAVVRQDREDADDGFVQCCGPGFTIPCAEALVSDDKTIFDEDGQSDYLLACVTLGTSGGSWHIDGTMWQCREEDLTDAGRALVAGLRALYNRDVHLLTFLDT